MSTQPWKPAWYTGAPEEHPRKDLVDKFNELLEKAPALEGVEYEQNVNYGVIGR